SAWNTTAPALAAKQADRAATAADSRRPCRGVDLDMTALPCAGGNRARRIVRPHRRTGSAAGRRALQDSGAGIAGMQVTETRTRCHIARSHAQCPAMRDLRCTNWAARWLRDDARVARGGCPGCGVRARMSSLRHCARWKRRAAVPLALWERLQPRWEIRVARWPVLSRSRLKPLLQRTLRAAQRTCASQSSRL